MRRLQAPTLQQWGCIHKWRTTTTRSGTQGILHVRYLTCRLCRLRVKTEERLAVPWDERDLVALVARAFPDGDMADVTILRTEGLLGGGLSRLNTRLAPLGWELALVRDRGQVVGAMRRRVPPEALGGTNKSQQREQ